MFSENASPAAARPAGLPSNVIALPRSAAPAEAGCALRTSVYQVRVAGKIFQGSDTRALLKLAVQARAARRV